MNDVNDNNREQVAAWHRQVGETERAYSAFEVYRDLGPGREIVEAYRVFHGCAEPKKVPGHFNDWARRYNWQRRATAFDQWKAATEDKAFTKATDKEAERLAKRRAKINENAFELYESILEKVRTILSMPLTRKTITDGGKTTIIEPINVRLRDAGYLLKVADELARLSAGMETSRETVEFKVEIEKIARDAGLPVEEVAREFERLTGIDVLHAVN